MKRKSFTRKKVLSKSLFVIGVGILLITLPIPFLSDFSDFFKFLGAILVLGGIFYLLFLKFPQNIFISEEELSKSESVQQKQVTKTEPPKISIGTLIFIFIIAGFILNQILIWKPVLSGSFSKPFSVSINITRKNGK